MIDYSKVKEGDKLRVTGTGAPGFAKLGDVVTVKSTNGVNRCDVVNEKGDEAYFAMTCGAQRLEYVEPESSTQQHDMKNRRNPIQLRLCLCVGLGRCA